MFCKIIFSNRQALQPSFNSGVYKLYPQMHPQLTHKRAKFDYFFG